MYSLYKKTVLILSLCFIFCFFLVSISSVKIVKADPDTFFVPDDYSTIQDAINAASDGDIVYVKSGEYLEYLVLNKSVSLVGENKETTTIYRSVQAYPDVYPTIVVSADNVNISGFTIKNDVSSPSSISSGAVKSHSGVHVISTKNCSLVDNNIVDSGYGIWLFGAYECAIYDNVITNCAHGIFFEESSANILSNNTVSNCINGLLLSSSGFNILRNNGLTGTFQNFGVSGSDLSHFINDVDVSNTIDDKKIYYLINKTNLIINPVSFPELAALLIVNCDDMTVQNLNVTNNYSGLHLFNVTNCKILQNVFSNNSHGGIWLQCSSDCVISENNVVSNTDWGIRLENSRDILVARNNSTYNQVQSIVLVNSDNNDVIDNDVTNYRFNENNGGQDQLYLKSSNNNRVINNQIFDDRGFGGVSLIDSSYNLLSSNNITIGGPGMSIKDNSIYNELIGNTFTTDRGSTGIHLYSSFNLLIGNVLDNFSTGVELSKVTNNTLIGNTIICREYCIDFLNSSYNLFYRNNFNLEARHFGANSRWNYSSVNFWDNGIEGNYWVDHKPNCNEGYGVCNQTYVIDADNQDNHPLVSPVKMFNAGLWNWTPYTVSVVSNSSVSNFSFSPEGTITFDVDGETSTIGFCRVAIPKELLDSSEHGWNVLINNESITPTIIKDIDNTFLNFTYSHTHKTIKIVGTTTIPEFPSWILLPLFLIAILIVTLGCKKLPNAVK